MSSMTQQKFVKNKHKPYGRSCLFANMRMLASLISRSLKILWSSSRAWSIRSLSTQSTTNINPCGRVCKLGRTLSLPPTSWENDSLNFLFWTQKCNRSYGMNIKSFTQTSSCTFLYVKVTFNPTVESVFCPDFSWHNVAVIIDIKINITFTSYDIIILILTCFSRCF